MRVKHKNRLNQTTVDTKCAETPRVATKTGMLRFTAAASRAMATVPTEQRDEIGLAAAKLAQLDDRALRGRIWDCHVALAASPEDVHATRPGVAIEDEVKAWRRARGLAAPAVSAPAVD
jgi:hypothetical protein